MEIVDPSDLTKHHHEWLEWLGLQEPPPEADSWVAVVRGLDVDDPASNSSRVGSRLVEKLGDAGISAGQRLYQFYDAALGATNYIPRSGMVTCAAVVVHDRDLTRAVAIATEFETTLARDPAAARGRSGLTDEELTRLALEAGPPPPGE